LRRPPQPSARSSFRSSVRSSRLRASPSILLALVLACGLAAGACGSSASPCDLDALLRRRAGAGAVDCGHVAVGAPTAATDQCVGAQLAQGHAFYARYDVQGIDSRAMLGALRDGAGKVSVLHWDSDPSGGAQSGARVTEIGCTGDPPLQTRLTQPAAVTPLSCTVAGPSSLACGM
jgi:hypothetical protein